MPASADSSSLRTPLTRPDQHGTSDKPALGNTSCRDRIRYRCTHKSWSTRTYRIVFVCVAYVCLAVVLKLNQYAATTTTPTTVDRQAKPALRTGGRVNEKENPTGVVSDDPTGLLDVFQSGNGSRLERAADGQIGGERHKREAINATDDETTIIAAAITTPPPPPQMVTTPKTAMTTTNSVMTTSEEGEKKYALLTFLRMENTCGDETHNEFPANFLTEEFLYEGGWVINFLVAIYMFGCVAEVCDNYFVPSLEHFCEDLGLTPDVAGATFMAAGSSAPEMCTSIVALFVAKSDVGLGAIVGSSIFNILVIVACVGLFAGMPLRVTWYPVTRDIIYYIIAVALMAIGLKDGHVEWYEALVMLIAYGGYIGLMVINTRIRRFLHKKKFLKKIASAKHISTNRKSSDVLVMNMEARGRSRIASRVVDPMALKSVEHDLKNLEEYDNDSKEATMQTLRRRSSMRQGIPEIKTEPPEITIEAHHDHGGTTENAEHQETHHGTDTLGVTTNEGEPRNSSEVDTGRLKKVVSLPKTVEIEEETSLDEPQKIAIDEYESPLTIPDGCFGKITYFLFIPTTVIHCFTIPDSRIEGGWQARAYPVSFTLAVAYISIYSYIMVWMALYAGRGVGIPDSVVGLTILAAGTSVPDLMSSVYIARDGYGDMAVSNAIGSNIFDILMGLGLPWFINAVRSQTTDEREDFSEGGLYYTVIMLFFTAGFCWTILFLNSWTLNKVVGAVTLLFYILSITFCILVEMNIILDFKGQPGPLC